MAGVVLIAIDSSPQAEAAFECKQKLHVFNLLATVLEFHFTLSILPL